MENLQPELFCLLIKNTWQKLSRFYNQRLDEFGLSVPKALLLLEVSPEKGENPHILANKMDLENSSISGLLQRLEKQELIERRPDPGDRRGVLIFLTPKGVEARSKIKALVNDLDYRLQVTLNPEEVKVFRRVITTIGKQISELSR